MASITAKILMQTLLLVLSVEICEDGEIVEKL